MKRIRTPLVAAIAAGMLVGSIVGVAAQEEPTDGYTFKRLAPHTKSKKSTVHGIAELPSGALVVIGGKRGGADGWRPLVWASADGGESWTKSRLEVDSIVAYGDEFVAVGRGTDDDALQASIFTSPDGVDWNVASTLEGADIETIITTPNGLAMLGLDFREADGWGDELAGYPSLWLSSDAETWSVQEITTPLYTQGTDDSDRRGLDGLAQSDSGEWLATGTVLDLDTDPDGPLPQAFHVWYSPDGIEWSRTTAPIPDTNGYFGTVTHPVWTTSGFLVSAFSNQPEDPYGLFLTTDGIEWEQVANIPGPDIPAMASDGTTVVGFQLPFETDAGPPSLSDGSAIYVSPDGRRWDQPTPFTLEKAFVNATTFTPDGRLLVAGGDFTACREFFCVFTPDDGAVPAVWISTPN